MPRIIKDESGADVEVFDKKEFEELDNKVKELEQDINPNWKRARENEKQLKKEKEELQKKLDEAGIKGEPKQISEEDVSRIAEQKYLERYKDRVSNQYGEKKEDVKKYFEKLAAGENLTEDKIDQLMNDAARAVGAKPSGNRDLQAQYGRQGSAPNFDPNAVDQGFGTTEAGKATAAAMGIIIEPPKK